MGELGIGRLTKTRCHNYSKIKVKKTICESMFFFFLLIVRVCGRAGRPWKLLVGLAALVLLAVFFRVRLSVSRFVCAVSTGSECC